MSEKRLCPHCNSEDNNKVIAVAMPMKFCHSCNMLWGEPFATIYTFIFAPIEMWLNGGSVFMCYEDDISYFHALWTWFKGAPDDDEFH